MNAHPKPLPPLRMAGMLMAERCALIDAREKQRCARCGVVIWSGGSRHHRKFKSRRGGDEVSNAVLLCGSGTTGCHGWVHANPVSARMAGLALLATDNPLLMPVRHAVYGCDVWLDDAGNASVTPPRLAA